MSISGITANDDPAQGYPIRTAAKALTANAPVSASGDVADNICTLTGATIQKPFSIPEADWAYAAAASGILNTTTAVTIKAAAGAGLRNYITGLQIASDNLGAATELVIRDGAGGTVLWRGKRDTAPPVTSVVFQTPLKSTANTLLEIATLTASITGSVYVNAQGYVAP